MIMLIRIYIYICMYVCIYIYIYIYRTLAPQIGRKPNPRSGIPDFGGFDSSRILVSRGGLLMSVGDSPESSSQQILVGIIRDNLSRDKGKGNNNVNSSKNNNFRREIGRLLSARSPPARLGHRVAAAEAKYNK